MQIDRSGEIINLLNAVRQDIQVLRNEVAGLGVAAVDNQRDVKAILSVVGKVQGDVDRLQRQRR